MRIDTTELLVLYLGSNEPDMNFDCVGKTVIFLKRFSPVIFISAQFGGQNFCSKVCTRKV